MLKLTEGQCGLCEHFGEGHDDSPTLVQIRINGEGPADYTDSCSHPDNAPLNLKVTPISGCAGFTPVRKAG